MTLAILRKTLRDLRWQVLGYGLGLALMGAFIAYIYPSYHEQLASFELPESLQALIGNADYKTGIGFLAGEFFSWTPILLVVFAIMAGTAVLANEESEGTLELVLAQPVSRGRLLLSKSLGVLVAAVAMMLLVNLGWAVSLPFVDTGVGAWRVFAATMNMVLIVTAFGALSLWLGAAVPDRRLATGIATAIAVASYFGNYLANLVDVVRPVRWLSLFFYNQGAGALTEGVDPAKAAVMVAVTGIFVLLALRAFQRRDIGAR